jgi:hypothetical protein
MIPESLSQLGKPPPPPPRKATHGGGWQTLARKIFWDFAGSSPIRSMVEGERRITDTPLPKLDCGTADAQCLSHIRQRLTCRLSSHHAYWRTAPVDGLIYKKRSPPVLSASCEVRAPNAGGSDLAQSRHPSACVSPAAMTHGPALFSTPSLKKANRSAEDYSCSCRTRATRCAVPCSTVLGLVCSRLNSLPVGLICRSNLFPAASKNISVPVQSASTV